MHQVFFISDGTGITAESMGHSLLTQFEHLEFNAETIPYVNTIEKAKKLLDRLKEANAATGNKVLIFSTIINPDIRAEIAKSDALLFDFFSVFIKPLEQHLHSQSSYRVGKAHSMGDYNTYKMRIDAINYALTCDDGANHHHYQKADVILTGVSRSGKTPTSLYLALQFGTFVANYPVTEEDIDQGKLPDFLLQHQEKLFGLTIDADQLHLIRSERRPNSTYSALETCKAQVAFVEKLFEQEKIPNLSTSNRSIEEIATSILEMMRIKRRLF